MRPSFYIAVMAALGLVNGYYTVPGLWPLVVGAAYGGFAWLLTLAGPSGDTR